MEIRTFLVGISPLSKIVLMVAMEIAHFYTVQFMFEDKSTLHYMVNEQFDSYEKKNKKKKKKTNKKTKNQKKKKAKKKKKKKKKKKTSRCAGKVKLTLVLFGIIEAYGKFIQFTYSRI